MVGGSNPPGRIERSEMRPEQANCFACVRIRKPEHVPTAVGTRGGVATEREAREL
ncbi:MAG: hypothetical protein Q7R73_03075 [bacterium]|nr:hypothetical protein [bacterium]